MSLWRQGRKTRNDSRTKRHQQSLFQALEIQRAKGITQKRMEIFDKENDSYSPTHVLMFIIRRIQTQVTLAFSLCDVCTYYYSVSRLSDLIKDLWNKQQLPLSLLVHVSKYVCASDLLLAVLRQRCDQTDLLQSK